jgi:hypothetical protein
VNKDARTKADSSRSSKTRKSEVRSQKLSAAGARRTWVVLAGLAGGLACTGALLKALAPPPLTPDATTSLLAIAQEQSIDQILDGVSVKPGRWRAIYVHQSLSDSSNAQSLGQTPAGLTDHFVIGNGDALTDGAVQPSTRWNKQLAAGNVPGVRISGNCICICVVGNFNRSRPTPNQEARLLELVAALQRRLNIVADQVVLGWDADQTSVAGIGKNFPLANLRSQLLQ